eukprot:6285315-Prymnesium_polylepis.1
MSAGIASPSTSSSDVGGSAASTGAKLPERNGLCSLKRSASCSCVSARSSLSMYARARLIGHFVGAGSASTARSGGAGIRKWSRPFSTTSRS